jgi:CheY-like chemotaxis protein
MIRKLILLVDDDETVLEFLADTLGADFDLLSAQSAEQALALALERRPDLVLCDIELPGMDGGDISAALFGRSETHDIPLLFLTALASPAELASKGHQLGGRAAVSKQSPLEEIVARVHAALA